MLCLYFLCLYFHNGITRCYTAQQITTNTQQATQRQTTGLGPRPTSHPTTWPHATLQAPGSLHKTCVALRQVPQTHALLQASLLFQMTGTRSAQLTCFALLQEMSQSDPAVMSHRQTVMTAAATLVCHSSHEGQPSKAKGAAAAVVSFCWLHACPRACQAVRNDFSPGCQAPGKQ